MRVLFLLAALALITAPASADPPTSLVLDTQGRIFYSDLENVWMVDTDGTVRIAVPNVHTHELYMDKGDLLYGEDVTNVGDNYRHRVWVRAPDGTITNTLPWRSGHPVDYNDYGFVRDETGRSFVMSRSERTLTVRDSDGVLRTIDLPQDGFVHWSTLGPSGVYYIGVGRSVYTLTPGESEFRELASDLGGRSVMFSFLHDRHAIMGMWTDDQGSVYVADYRGRAVLRITESGDVSTTYRSSRMWSPAGGIWHDNDLLLLEASHTNRIRVVRVAPDGTKTIYQS